MTTKINQLKKAFKRNNLSKAVIRKVRVGNNFIVDYSEIKATIKPVSMFFSLEYYVGYKPYACIKHLVDEMCGTDKAVAKQAHDALEFMCIFYAETFGHSISANRKEHELMLRVMAEYIKHNREVMEDAKLKKDISDEELSEDIAAHEAMEVIEEHEQ